MTRSQVAKLLAFAAAFDRRTVGEADVEAWLLILDAVDYEQAHAAVVAHYATETRWIMPADIRTGVRKTRRALLHEFQYEPVAGDETPRGYLTALRRQLRAVGDGRRPAQVLALPAGRINPDRVAALVADYGQLPAAGPARTPQHVTCPYCHASPGKPCATPGGKRMGDVHPSRVDAFHGAR